MNDMLERVARAIAHTPMISPHVTGSATLAQFCDAARQVVGVEADWATFDAQMMQLARAAIEAMREPTDRVLLAIGKAEAERGDGEYTWKSAIDAILTTHTTREG